MTCYQLIDGALKPVIDPTIEFEQKEADADQVISMAGYTARLCSSRLSDFECAEISIFETEDITKPRYYIDVMGTYQTIATLVADDFPALLATLKELQPLIALIGFEQRARIEINKELPAKK